MKHHPLLRAAVFCLCATTASPFAWSQTPAPGSDAASAQADDLTHRGVNLLKKHQWAEAEELFRQAWALKRSYDIAGNLGLAEAGLGKWRDAAEHLTFALATFPANGKAAHRDLLREKLASAREHVGGLTIEMDAPGAEVLVDGKSVGTAPLAGEVLVEPGAHVVEAQLAGRGAARGEASVVAGGSASVTLALKSEQAPPPPPPVVPVKRSVVPGAVLGGVAGAALVTGLGLFAGGRAKLSTAHDMNAAIVGAGHSCVAKAANYDPTCADLYSTASTSNTLQRAGVGLMVGAGAAAVATVIYFVLPTSGSKPSSTGTLRVTPALAPAAAGLVFSGAF